MSKLPSHEQFGFKLKLQISVGSRASRTAISYSIVLMVLQQFCGCYVLLNYMTLYFEEVGSQLNPIQSSIIITMVQCVANILTTFLIEKLGRKILYVVSAVGTCLGMFILAMHSLYKDQLPGFEWVPIYVFSFTIFIASVGLLSVTNIIFIDILPPKVCNSSTQIRIHEFYCFIILYIYPDTNGDDDNVMHEYVDSWICNESRVSISSGRDCITWLPDVIQWYRFIICFVCFDFHSRNQRQIV